MKKIAILSIVLALFVGISGSHAQGVSISTDNSVPDGSAILDIKSTEQGILIPRMTAAERDAISNAAHGLLVFCTDDICLYMNHGNPSSPDWKKLSSFWIKNGNDIYYTGGNVGIGNPAPLM